MAAHHVVHDAGGAGIIGLMHNRVPAVENPVIRVCPFDANASLVAGDDAGRTQNCLRFLSLDLEPGMRADEHVHQRALAHGEPERIAEQAAQTLVRKRLETLQINRKRVDARPEWGRRRDRRRRSLRFEATRHASARVAAMAHDVWFDRRYLDLVVFADQLAGLIRGKPAAALLADARHVVAKLVRIIRQPAVVRLMPELRPTRARVLALFFLIRGGRLGRGSRILVGTLKLKHQIYQLLFAELLQISPVHSGIDSEFSHRGKGVGNCFKGAIADYSRKFSNYVSFDIALYFNSVYQHDIVGWFSELGADSEDVDGTRQLLREINSGRSVDCLPQGLYPTKMIGNDFLRFIDNHHELKSKELVRFMDDFYLFSGEEQNLSDDFQLVQRLLGEKGLSINPQKTRKNSATHTEIDTE